MVVIIALLLLTLKCENILFLTDIHLDLTYDSLCPLSEYCRNGTAYLNPYLQKFDYGRYNCDTPINIWNNFIERIKTEKIDLIILNGDQIAHRLYKLDINEDIQYNKNLFRKTFETIFNSLKGAFPSVTILPTIGNNDFYEHFTTPEETLSEQVMFLNNLYFNNIDNLNEDYDITINKGMFYSYKKFNTKFIFINANLYSLRNHNFNKELADFQLKWIYKELINSNKVVLLMHIPPYPDFKNNEIEFTMREEYVREFENIMYAFNNKIIKVFGSHLHWNKIGIRVRKDIVIKDNPNRLPDTPEDIILNTFLIRSKKILLRRKPFEIRTVKYMNVINFPSFTSAFGNNPGYTIIEYNSQQNRILNIISHHADLKGTLNADESYSLNVEKDNLWSIKYDYKEDFKFVEFDNEDSYDFVYNRLKDESIGKLYLLSSGGFARDYDEKLYLRYPDLNDKRIFCVYKILYNQELDTCD